MNFIDKLEESYKGFAQGSDLDLGDLRLMYYGRQKIYIAFTDDGEYDYESSYYELDRPDSILCHPVNDVVGRRAKSSEFYMNVIRYNKSGHLTNIKNYSKDDFKRDVAKLSKMKFNSDIFDFYVELAKKDTKIRHEFERLWDLTDNLSRVDGSDSWRGILLNLGYNQISDPSGIGVLAIGRDPVSLILDFDGVENIDILPAQKKRADPRRRVRDKVNHKLKSMRNNRRRIAKRMPSKKI